MIIRKTLTRRSVRQHQAKQSEKRSRDVELPAQSQQIQSELHSDSNPIFSAHLPADGSTVDQRCTPQDKWVESSFNVSVSTSDESKACKRRRRSSLASLSQKPCAATSVEKERGSSAKPSLNLPPAKNEAIADSAVHDNSSFYEDDSVLAMIDLCEAEYVRQSASVSTDGVAASSSNASAGNDVVTPPKGRCLESSLHASNEGPSVPETAIAGRKTQAESSESPTRAVVAGEPGRDANNETRAAVSAAMSMQTRIRRALQQNASVSTTPEMLRAKKLRDTTLRREIDDAPPLPPPESPSAAAAADDFFGLPAKVKVLLEKVRGIKELFPWQRECLNLPAVRRGGNLVYSLPTSGGKTLVAEILVLRQLLLRRRNAALVLPYVSIVTEKVQALSPFADALGFLVEEYAGSRGAFPPVARRRRNSVYVCTIEKAHALTNSLVETGRLDSLGLVVVDELHMIGDGGRRGATLEAMLAKLMFVAGGDGNRGDDGVQIVGMSATLRNVDELAAFLDAELFTSDFRPVALTEYLKVGADVYEIDQRAASAEDRLTHRRVVVATKAPAGGPRRRDDDDPDHLLTLALEVIPAHSCLVFCSTKKNCENVAMNLCRRMDASLREVRARDRRALRGALALEGEGQACPILRYTMQYGVAYHHGGLTVDERRLIEAAYLDGALCLLACTSTLAAGVNLPARRVILRAPYVGRELITRSQYKQMVGRAGRAGIDSAGESVLVVQPGDRARVVAAVVGGAYETCRSSLPHDDGGGIESLALSCVGLGVAGSRERLRALMRRTLLARQSPRPDAEVATRVDVALASLVERGLVREDGGGALAATRLGRAAFKGPVNHALARTLYDDLRRAQGALHLASHLHLLYLVTPYEQADAVRVDWMTYLDALSRLDADETRAAAAVGVTEGYVARRIAGGGGGGGPSSADAAAVARRFYVTLMLLALWKRATVWEVAQRFSCSRGFAQGLHAAAAGFAACASYFAGELAELWPYPRLLADVAARLSSCTSPELAPLTEIAGVRASRARALHAAGFRAPADVAAARPDDLARRVAGVARKQAATLIASARIVVTATADALREQADELLRASRAQTPVAASDDRNVGEDVTGGDDHAAAGRGGGGSEPWGSEVSVPAMDSESQTSALGSVCDYPS
ncbi:PREDICTED: helicase POLQ-like [Priapulus caudatus]|uniref:Helicase POLQ-like n=1 Tax=Priapulus caudatus TaxID=37621 RepID=A0ABM1DPE9_PRICU|nr:PREDICTED: helicase POLQ-like [Priapulus caudatus]